MRYSIAQYAESIRRALRQSRGKGRRLIVARFLRILQKQGNSRNLRLILKAAERQEAGERGTRLIRIEYAGGFKQAFRNRLEQHIENARIRYVPRPELLGGVRIFIDGETLIDASARTRLERLFRKHKARSPKHEA
ncbi:MAG: F0F1 ATP synthase subunit delta [Candidatus Sungbacteria bacterium]|nr:F0F1 ATP synthase subunit delta [Candidatus Sungbacteria bacterium]